MTTPAQATAPGDAPPAEQWFYLHCNECQADRRHALRSSFYLHGSKDAVDDDGHPAPFDCVEVLQCLGCETPVCRRCAWRGGTYHRDHDGSILVLDGEAINYFPSRSVRQRPTWLRKLPQYFFPVLDEVYTALDNGSTTLAAIGVRTVIDVLARKVVGDTGSFRSKLDALEKKGWLAARDKARLAIVVDAGSAAAHRAFKGTRTSLDQMMDSLEHLLKSRYVLDREAKELRRATPRRKRK